MVRGFSLDPISNVDEISSLWHSMILENNMVSKEVD